MYRILIAIDGSEHSRKVIDETLLIAEALKAEVTIITVVGENVLSPGVSIIFTDEDWDRIKKNLHEEAEGILESAAAPFREKGLTVRTKVIIGRKTPSEAICDAAEKEKYSLVVLGSHGLRGVKETFLGSVSNKVAHCVEGSVLIVK